MIVYTSEPFDGACVVHLDGSFQPSDDAAALAMHLVNEAGQLPLLIDLSGLHPATGAQVGALLRSLANAPARSTTVIVHPDLETRRWLRARGHGLPVVPSNDLVLQGRFASALVADHPQIER